MTRYGVPIWSELAGRQAAIDTTRLRGPLDAPVAIVGGGLTGCAVAYACAAAGIDVVLLEADRLGRAPGAGGDGLVRGEPVASFRALEARVGRRAARAMFAASRRAVLDLAATLRRLSPRVRVEPQDAFRIAGPFAADAALSREAAARAEAGLDARWMKGAAASTRAATPTTGAMRMTGWGIANPLAVTSTLARAAAARGARLFEQSPVRRIRTRGRQVEIQTGRGTVTADTVVVCTGEPTALFRPLARHFHLQERYAAVTDPLPAAVRKQMARDAIVADVELPPHAVRWAGGDRLLIAGADGPRTPARTKGKLHVQRTGQLMYELSRLYPAISGIRPSHGWDIPVALSADEAMVAGPHRNYPRHLFALGTGHDPAAAFLASRIVLRHLQGDATRDDGYFGFTRG